MLFEDVNNTSMYKTFLPDAIIELRFKPITFIIFIMLYSMLKKCLVALVVTSVNADASPWINKTLNIGYVSTQVYVDPHLSNPSLSLGHLPWL